MKKSSRNETTRLFFYCEINSYFKFDITCFLVKVRSCLLARALMRASRRMALAFRHFGYRRGHTCPDSFEFAPQRLEHPLSVCQRGLVQRNILSDRYFFLCFQDIALISIGAKTRHGLREEFLLPHGSTLQ